MALCWTNYFVLGCDWVTFSQSHLGKTVFLARDSARLLAMLVKLVH